MTQQRGRSLRCRGHQVLQNAAIGRPESLLPPLHQKQPVGHDTAAESHSPRCYLGSGDPEIGPAAGAREQNFAADAKVLVR